MFKFTCTPTSILTYISICIIIADLFLILIYFKILKIKKFLRKIKFSREDYVFIFIAICLPLTEILVNKVQKFRESFFYEILLISALLLGAHFYAKHLQLKKQKNYFRFSDLIVNHGKSLIVCTDVAGRVIFCSNTVNHILGYSVKEMMGMGFWIRTEDREFIGKAYHDSFVSDKVYVRKLKCQDGTYKYIQWIDKLYTKKFVIGIGHDITDKIELENLYQKLVDASHHIIFELDENNCLIFVNKFFCELTGYEKNEIINQQFYFLIRPDYRRIIISSSSK
jgi:PAS domain S-box-containing protein